MRGTRALVFADRIEINRGFCRLVGYFVAEGSVNGRDAISFTFAAHERGYCEDVKQLMQSLFGISCANERKKGGSVELIFYSKILQQTFSSLFYTDAKTHRAHTKVVPQWMVYLPVEKQAEIFRGWWRGDAGYTASRGLMNQMKMIALRLGIVPSILMASMEKFNRGNHKIDGRVIKMRHNLFQFSNLAFFEDTFGLRDDPVFRRTRFMPKLTRQHGWIDEAYIYMPIRDIETKDHNGAVYNLEVEEDHSYLTEFAAVHNCWTPWFSLFGSMSGFDSMRECFEEYTDQILAIETGSSSDPAMNWRLSQLDPVSIVSFSDAHSPRTNKFGREATVLRLALPSFRNLRKALDRRNPDGENAILRTIEFFPEEGKYHYDGHRACGVSYPPEETAKRNAVCEKCGKRVTVGVLYRVGELADRPIGRVPADRPPFASLIPLSEIIAEAIGGQGVWTKGVDRHYHRLISALGDEFAILLRASRSEIEAESTPEIANGVMRVREGRLNIEPGYDGEYGIVKIFGSGEQRALSVQASLF